MQDMLRFIDSWMKMTQSQREAMTIDELRFFTNETFLKLLKQTINNSKKKKYIYMITFTIDPSKNTDQTKEDLESIIDEFVTKQANRKGLNIVFFAMTKEYTQQNMAHWHVVIQSTKTIKKDRFAYYSQTYGNVDISRTKGTTYTEALNYISKDGPPRILIS